ncbi:acyltransferase [Flavobacterium sp. ACN6]|uniref:acyltransferase family protein n=1 Tax=Flavobacterium sp. ACN6 TaxID=1920426 RepID=UPI000BB30030|nr:acyltransferase [Flavobacterium sp. ACN6]PBJ13873.1 O-acetyltransferase OatA [Flavobacterium sp. ACN6]
MLKKFKNVFNIEISPNRIFGLDLLRTVAILSVVIGHANILLPEKTRKIFDLFVVDGVGIFFVLSGFLIGGILIKTIENKGFNSKILMDFWVRRWFRTLPAYFLVLTFLIVLYSILKVENFDFNMYIKYYFFSQNLFQSHPVFFPEAWSLSIEEWFYIITPVLIFGLVFLRISNKMAVLITCILVLLSITFLRMWTFMSMEIMNHEQFGEIFKKRVFMRMDALMYGVFAAYLNYYYNHIFLLYKKFKFIIGLFLFTFSNIYIPSINGFYIAVLYFSVNSVATFLVLPYLYTFHLKEGKIFYIVTYISLISYSMYLLNYTIILKLIIGSIIPWYLVTTNLTFLMFYKLLFFWIALILLSILLYKYFEIPMMKLRDNKKIKEVLKIQ